MALEPINCTSHSREIEEAYLKVVRGDDSDTTWVILSPNGKKEYTAAFVGADFSEFLETFDDAKVQFGLARVSPPGSDVEKLILIGWCPDSAPMKTRASFAANFGTVANQVLKGYHVQVTARDEDDLDERELLQKISNAAGARYSIQTNNDKSKPSGRQQKVSSPRPAATPSKSIPKPKQEPSPPVSSGASKAGDTDDWGEPEVEERDLDKDPVKTSQSTYKPIGKVDLQKVIAEENAKADPRLVSSTDSSSKIEPEADIARLKQQSKLKRDNEINKFLGTKPPAGSALPKNDDLVIKGFKNEKSPAQLWAEKKAASAGSSQSPEKKAAVESSPAADQKEDAEEDDQENDVSDLKSKFEKLGASNNEPPIITPRQTRPAAPEKEIEPPVKASPKQFGTPLPGMHTEISNDAEDESDDGDWDDDEPSAPALPPKTSTQEPKEKEKEPVSSIPQPPKRTEPEDTEEQDQDEEEDEEDAEEVEEPAAPSLPSRSAVAPPPPARRSVEPAKPAGPSALAEYDYEAAEENELTFSENDKIINIDFVDDDWWLGELEKSGEKGLFPSNYVTLNE